MSTRDDVLDVANVPDRVFYELGVMLDKQDFESEQTYHRGRLARALAFLHGAGTVAGLRVEVTPDTAPPQPDAEEVRVHPGIAVDEIGRLIDVTTLRCTRLAKWIAAQVGDTQSEAGLVKLARLAGSLHAGKLVVDVMLRFAACDRGKTPAFATGPFDALDAVQPSRVRDGFEILLVPRDEATPPTPPDVWPPLTGTAAERRAALRQAIYAAWEKHRPRDRRLDPVTETERFVPEWLDPYNDHHWLLLARLGIPATLETVDGRQVPRRIAAEAVTVDDTIRPFVYTSGAVLRLLTP